MARGSRRSAGRGARRSSARRQPAPADVFDDEWLSDIRERFDARYIDLTRHEDRRRWHPDNLKAQTQRPLPRTLRGRHPRIVVVPEKHRLARLATYGGTVPLGRLFARRGDKRRLIREWQDQALVDPHGFKYHARVLNTRISPRLGFHLPWQVIICVRRKKRREVMHALKIAGRKGVGAGKRQRRTEYSEVVC